MIHLCVCVCVFKNVCPWGVHELNTISQSHYNKRQHNNLMNNSATTHSCLPRSVWISWPPETRPQQIPTLQSSWYLSPGKVFKKNGCLKHALYRCYRQGLAQLWIIPRGALPGEYPKREATVVSRATTTSMHGLKMIISQSILLLSATSYWTTATGPLLWPPLMLFKARGLRNQNKAMNMVICYQETSRSSRDKPIAPHTSGAVGCGNIQSTTTSSD